MDENRRLQRVEKELQVIVAKFLQQGFKDRLYGLVSVSRVESNPKLRTAKIFVSVFGSDQDVELSLEALQNNLPDIQRQVSKQLRMKFVPRVSIHLDKGMEKLLIVESKLREIALQKKAIEDNSED